MQLAQTYRTFSRESLAAELGVTPRRISYWVNVGVMPPAHGSNPRWAYYDDHHVRRGRAILRDVYDARITFADYRERLDGAA